MAKVAGIAAARVRTPAGAPPGAPIAEVGRVATAQIAAGQLIERPASVVKELVENAVDAGGRTISVEIERGGSGLVVVSDDGCGMGREAAMQSLHRYATCKIRDAADLSAIRTMGFRGEALALIASVAQMRIVTRRAADPAGTEIIVAGGDMAPPRKCDAAAGTRIEVRELFFNTPARLKFLKTVATEQSAVAEVTARLAIAHWRVAFRLVADGRIVYGLPRARSLLGRIRQIYGAKLASRMLHFNSTRAAVHVSGLAIDGQDHYPTPRRVFTFVNQRAVRNRVIQRAIDLAYDTLIPRGRFPAAVVFVEMRPEDVDVNVHPMKTEVRFRDSGTVYAAVYHAVRERLADQPMAFPAAEVVEDDPKLCRAVPVEGPAARTATVLRLVPKKSSGAKGGRNCE